MMDCQLKNRKSEYQNRVELPVARLGLVEGLGLVVVVDNRKQVELGRDYPMH